MEFLKLLRPNRKAHFCISILGSILFLVPLSALAQSQRENTWLCMPAPNAEMVYTLVPNSQFVTLGVPFQTNAFGFRDQPIYQKDENTFRVLCVGDSVTFGTGVKNEETFPNVLESMLSQSVAPNRRIDVINAGVSAYNARNIRGLLFEYLDEIQPDVVVYTFVENDLDDSVSPGPGGWLIALDPSKSPDEPFISDDFPAVWLMRRSETRQPGIMDKVFSYFDNPMAQVSKAPPPLLLGNHPETARRWTQFQLEMQQMKQLCEARGIPLAVYSFALQDHSEPISDRVGEVCSQIGVPHASSLPIFHYDSYMSTYSLGYDPHFNPHGHRLMADRLLCFLIDQNLLPETIFSQPLPHRHYAEVANPQVSEALRAQALVPPHAIDFSEDSGAMGILAGVDPEGKMARYSILRLAGPGKQVLVTASNLVGTPTQPQTMWLEVEGERVEPQVQVADSISQYAFDVPDRFWDRNIEIRITAGGQVWIPEPKDRQQGATPQTLRLHRVERF